ncbi:MAG: GNAT family N-acetyltransferase [Sedimenticolaceae bacterium]
MKKTPQSEWKAAWRRQGDAAGWVNTDGIVEHDIDWLLDQCDGPEKAVIVLFDDSSHVVPLFTHTGSISFNFGEVELASTTVRRYALAGNFPHLSQRDWELVLSALRAHLETDAAVYLLGVVEGEGLCRAIRAHSTREAFWCSRHGKHYARRFCNLADGYEAYLRSLPARHRKKLKRSLKRFEARFADYASFSCHVSVDEVDVFLTRVEPVSNRTYQAQLLDNAVKREGHVGRQLLQGARRGNVRCYLLAIDGHPIAWRIGTVYQGTFFSQHVGYDPDYAEWHPGVITHLYSAKDLADTPTGVTTIDLLYGDNDFKRKISTSSRQECNYYCFPKTAKGTSTHAVLSLCNAISEGCGNLLERYGVKQMLKRRVRRQGGNDQRRARRNTHNRVP